MHAIDYTHEKILKFLTQLSNPQIWSKTSTLSTMIANVFVEENVLDFLCYNVFIKTIGFTGATKGAEA